jgi:hypothetical protein
MCSKLQRHFEVHIVVATYTTIALHATNNKLGWTGHDESEDGKLTPVGTVVQSGAMDQDGPTVVASHHGHATLEQKLVVVAVASHHRHATLEQKLVVAAVALSGTKGHNGPTAMASPHEPLLLWKRGERKQSAMPWMSL